MKLLKYLWAWLVHLLGMLFMIPFALWESVTLWAWEFNEVRPRWEKSTPQQNEKVEPPSCHVCGKIMTPLHCTLVYRANKVDRGYDIKVDLWGCTSCGATTGCS